MVREAATSGISYRAWYFLKAFKLLVLARHSFVNVLFQLGESLFEL